MQRSLNKKLQNLLRYATALLLLLFATTVAGLSGKRIESQMQEQLISAADQVAEALSVEDALALTFTEADIDRPQFQSIHDQLQAYKQLAGYTDICLHALRDGLVIFGPSALPEDHPQYKPPGTVLDDTSGPALNSLCSGTKTIRG